MIVLLRVTSLLSIFASMVILTVAIIMRPWKLSIYGGDQMEIGVWTICRITKKSNKCYDDWYGEHYERKLELKYLTGHLKNKTMNILDVNFKRNRA